jgi:DNA (cytosine-5)-methyltransferase 1
MQGFPDDFEFPVSRVEAMKQLGNSVAVTAVQDYAESILNALRERYDEI